MVLSIRRIVGVVVLASTLLCTACVTTTIPWTASGGGQGPADKRLVETWELLHQIDDKGEKHFPIEGTRTLMEFTDKGRVIFNRIDKENTSRVNNRTGTYTQKDNGLIMTDDGGRNVRWTYTIQDDTLAINAPELKTTFYWRRFR